MIAVQGYTRVWLRLKHWPEQAHSLFKRLFFPAQNIPRATVSAPRALAVFLFRSYKKNKSGLQFLRSRLGRSAERW